MELKITGFFGSFGSFVSPDPEQTVVYQHGDKIAPRAMDRPSCLHVWVFWDFWDFKRSLFSKDSSFYGLRCCAWVFKGLAKGDGFKGVDIAIWGVM